MQCNIGSTDRAIRTIIGIAIIGFGIMMESWWGLAGFVLVLTAIIGWCPPYQLMDINTGCTREVDEANMRK